MLITELKNKDIIKASVQGKAFVLVCHGCKEVHFPEHEVEAFRKELAENGTLTGSITTDYICNPENLDLRLAKYAAEIEAADVILVLSCGVGVQTVADLKDLNLASDAELLEDYRGNSLLVFSSLWSIDYNIRKNPGLVLSEIVVAEG